jgi:hypothetical protein
MPPARQIMRRRPPSEDPASFERIRKLAIIAMFSGDLLMDRESVTKPGVHSHLLASMGVGKDRSES